MACVVALCCAEAHAENQVIHTAINRARVDLFPANRCAIGLTELWRDEAGVEQCLGIFPRATRTAWKDGIGTHYLSVPAAGIALLRAIF